MKEIRAVISIDLDTYLKDLKKLKEWCHKKGIIYITCNLPKKTPQARRHYVITFDITFGYLFVGAWVGYPTTQTSEDHKYKIYRSISELQETILQTKYSKHCFENKNNADEYRKGEMN